MGYEGRVGEMKVSSKRRDSRKRTTIKMQFCESNRKKKQGIGNEKKTKLSETVRDIINGHLLGK
jgi:hypothetical protein